MFSALNSNYFLDLFKEQQLSKIYRFLPSLTIFIVPNHSLIFLFKFTNVQ